MDRIYYIDLSNILYKRCVMSLTEFKVLIVVLIIVFALLGAYFAIKTKESPKGTYYLSLGNTFAAGIFMGAGLIHMLPDAAEGFGSVIKTDFPIAAFIASLGFLLILFLEKVLVLTSESPLNGKKVGGKVLSPYILLFILSVHSIIVGIALGTEDRMSQSIIIAIAVLAHKGSAAFALVVDMIRNHLTKKLIAKLIVLFSFMTPLGVLIGAFIANVLTGAGAELTIAFFDALAAGTFLYVAIMEIFSEELNQPKDTLLKFVVATLGLLLMALLAVWL